MDKQQLDALMPTSGETLEQYQERVNPVVRDYLEGDAGKRDPEAKNLMESIADVLGAKSALDIIKSVSPRTRSSLLRAMRKSFKNMDDKHMDMLINNSRTGVLKLLYEQGRLDTNLYRRTDDDANSPLIFQTMAVTTLDGKLLSAAQVSVSLLEDSEASKSTRVKLSSENFDGVALEVIIAGLEADGYTCINDHER